MQWKPLFQKPISELSEALEALGTDKLLIQTANGTKIIQASILAPALLSPAGRRQRRQP